MENQFGKILEAIAGDADLENDWLDLLSQLEYVGCRKILKSVPFEVITSETLQHIAEEAAHAHLLKALVRSETGSERSWRDNPLGEIGWRYFQTLDKEISQLAGVGSMNYPAVSWAVEQRVLTVYPMYLELTSNDSVKRVLARILSQERRHGGQFDQADFPEGLKERMLAIEARLWNELVTDLEDVIFPSAEPLSIYERYTRGPEYAELRATD